ncbi:MAG: M28 family peptidase, partial [Clostridia bacterium]|nr:M28 family peptidase [Clostridia bacterium]
HYDTCAVLPFPNFITPKNFLIYLLYQIAVSVLLLGVGYGVGFLLMYLSQFFASNQQLMAIVYFIGVFVVQYWPLAVVIWLIGFGAANKHTANDNTSGVTTLIDIMNALPDELKNKVAFVFFDLEEAGLIGSSAFKSKHRKTMKNKLLVNFDCVSDGENMLFAIKRKAKKFLPYLESAFIDRDKVTVELATHGVFYPSDQSLFPCGVGVAALKKTKRLGILYMNRIHTPRDVIFREENIEYLTQGAVKLAQILPNDISE